MPYARRRSTERFQITAARLDYGTMRSAEAIAVEAPSLPVSIRSGNRVLTSSALEAYNA